MSDFIVAITGGVASGKSTVDALFRTRGVVVADADIAARDAVAPGSDGLAEVVAEFGTGVLDATGQLDRPAMRRRVFADADARRRLEAIIHPRVREALRDLCRAATGAYAIASIPLLAEGGGREAYPWLQRILVVDVPGSVQLARLLQRDGIDDVLARTMIAAQASRRERLAIADDVLVNDGHPDHLDAPVRELDARYRALAASL